MVGIGKPLMSFVDARGLADDIIVGGYTWGSVGRCYWIWVDVVGYEQSPREGMPIHYFSSSIIFLNDSGGGREESTIGMLLLVEWRKAIMLWEPGWRDYT